jgi:hypothetical protein
MDKRTTTAGAAVLEGLVVVALIGAVVFGLVRTVFSPVLFGQYVPSAIQEAGRDLLGPRYFGELPSVRAELAPALQVRTTPDLYVYPGGVEVPPGRGEFSGPYEAQVNAYGPSGKQKLGLVGAELVETVATIVVLLLLLRIVRTLRRGDPFALDNARRLRVIAAAVVIGGLGGAALRAWGEHLVLADSAIAPFVNESLDLSLTPLWAALVVWLLAEVFRRGALMRRDLEGLV